MSYLLLSIMLLAVFHFVYESIVAPSWRLSIRFRLFALRDELRTLKMNHGEQLDNKHFNYLQDSINSIIHALPRIEVTTVAHIKLAIESDPELKARLVARQKILDDCVFPEMGEIRKRSIKLSLEVLAANSAGWVIYFIPFMYLASVYKSLERRVRALISLSDPDLAKVAPEIKHDGCFAA
ncbi:MAG TPA: hypothetical protein VIY48_08865 [Candidatus Paceibacterota bacterium]